MGKNKEKIHRILQEIGINLERDRIKQCNLYFIVQLYDFGVRNLSIYTRILSYGEIGTINILDDCLEVLYITGKEREAVIERNSISKIGVNNEVANSQVCFFYEKRTSKTLCRRRC